MSPTLILSCVLATWLFTSTGAITVPIDRSDINAPPTRSSMIANGWRPLTGGYDEVIGTNVSPSGHLAERNAVPHPVLGKFQEHMVTSEKLKPPRKSKPTTNHHDYSPPSILGSFTVMGHAAAKARGEAQSHSNHLHKHIGSETREYAFLIPPPKDVYRFDIPNHHRKPIVRDSTNYLRQPQYAPQIVHQQSDPVRSATYFIKGYASSTSPTPAPPSSGIKTNVPYVPNFVTQLLQPPRHQAKPFESLKLNNAKPYLQPPGTEVAPDFNREKLLNENYDRFQSQSHAQQIANPVNAGNYYSQVNHPPHHYKTSYERDPAFLVHESHEVSYVTPSTGYQNGYSFRPSLPYDSLVPPDVYSSSTQSPTTDSSQDFKRPGQSTTNGQTEETVQNEALENSGVTNTYFVSEQQDLTPPPSAWPAPKSKYTSDINEVLPRVNPPSKFNQEVIGSNQISQTPKVVYVRPQQQYPGSVLPLDARPQTAEYETPESISLKHFNEQQFLIQQQLVQRDRQRLAEQERQQQLEIERQQQEELKSRQEELKQLIQRQKEKEEEEARLAEEKVKNQTVELSKITDVEPYTIQLAQYEVPKVTTEVNSRVPEQSTFGEQPRIQQSQVLQPELQQNTNVQQQYQQEVTQIQQYQQELNQPQVRNQQQLEYQQQLQAQQELENQQQLQNQQLQNQQLQSQQLQNQQLQNQQLQNQQLQNQQLQNQQLEYQTQLQNQQQLEYQQQLQNQQQLEYQQQLQNQQQLEYQQQLQNNPVEYQPQQNSQNQQEAQQLQNKHQQQVDYREKKPEVRPYRPQKPSRDQHRRKPSGKTSGKKSSTTVSYETVSTTETPIDLPETSVPLTLVIEDIPIQTTVPPETLTVPTATTQRTRPRRPGSSGVRRRRPSTTTTTTTTEEPIVVPSVEEDFLKYGKPEETHQPTNPPRRNRVKPTQVTIDDAVTEKRANIRKRPGHRFRVNHGEPFDAEIVTEIVQNPVSTYRDTTVESVQRYNENSQFSTSQPSNNQYFDYTSQRLQPTEDQREDTTQSVQLDYLTEITKTVGEEYSSGNDRNQQNIVTNIPLEDLFIKTDGNYYDRATVASLTTSTAAPTTTPQPTTQAPLLTSTTLKPSKIRPLRYGNSTRPRFSIKDYKSRLDYKNRLSQISTTEASVTSATTKQRGSSLKNQNQQQNGDNTRETSGRYKYMSRLNYRTTSPAPQTQKDETQTPEDSPPSTTERTNRFVPKRRPVSANVYRSRVSGSTSSPSRSTNDGEVHSAKYSTGRPENVYSSSIRRRPTMKMRLHSHHKETSTAGHPERKQEEATEMTAEETSFYSAVTTSASAHVVTNEIVEKTEPVSTNLPIKSTLEENKDDVENETNSTPLPESTTEDLVKPTESVPIVNSTVENAIASQISETTISERQTLDPTEGKVESVLQKKTKVEFPKRIEARTDEEELFAKASQSVADLTSSASALYDKPGMFKAVSPESRVVSSHFKITTDEPTLPIEAFFQELTKKN